MTANTTMTRLEREYLEFIASLGCAVDGCSAPAEIHHPRFAAGMGQRAGHFLAIPLCAEHHRNGGQGVALHACPATFECLYGSEARLLEDTARKVFRTLYYR